MQEYEWNSPERLPPVECPLVIRVGVFAVRVERITYLQQKTGEMDYRLQSGDVVRGRYPWSYP